MWQEYLKALCEDEDFISKRRAVLRARAGLTDRDTKLALTPAGYYPTEPWPISGTQCNISINWRNVFLINGNSVPVFLGLTSRLVRCQSFAFWSLRRTTQPSERRRLVVILVHPIPSLQEQYCFVCLCNHEICFLTRTDLIEFCFGHMFHDPSSV